MLILFRPHKASKGDLDIVRESSSSRSVFTGKGVTYEEYRMLSVGLESLVKESLGFITIGGRLHFHLLGYIGELILFKSRRDQRSYGVQWSVRLPNPPTQHFETLLVICRA